MQLNTKVVFMNKTMRIVLPIILVIAVFTFITWALKTNATRNHLTPSKQSCLDIAPSRTFSIKA